MTRKLKERLERFCRAYTLDLNATNAALTAGYARNSAYSQGQRLLKNSAVAARIDEIQRKQCEKLDITAERVLTEIAKLAYSNMDDYVDVVSGQRVLNTGKATRDQMAAVQEITEDNTGGSGDGERKVVVRTRFKLVDKGINLERLGRHLKLFTDKVEHSGLNGLGDRLNKIRQRKNAD